MNLLKTPVIELNQVKKSYHQQVVVNNLSMMVKQNQIVSLVGRSGCGKTTILKLIAGLVKPDSGKVVINSPTVGYMPQNYLLLEYQNIYQNIILPLKLKKQKIAQVEIMRLVKLFKLEQCLLRYPHEISGGMKSRVALLRAYLMSEKLLLLDEPFAALDAITKLELQTWLKQLLNNLQVTIVYITHDVLEAITMSDEIYVLQKKAKIKAHFQDYQHQNYLELTEKISKLL